MKIVMGDDDLQLAISIRDAIHLAGHNVVGIGTDAASVIEMCELHCPDVAILDMEMPGSGLAAARKISELNIPVVFLTAYDDSSNINAAIKAGAIEFLIKPVNTKSIISTCKVAIEKSKRWRELNNQLRDTEQKLADRKILERAKGILMKNQGINEGEAYRHLQAEASRKQVTIVSLAKVIIEADDILSKLSLATSSHRP